MKLIDNYIYFYHLDKFCVIPTYPDDIRDTLNSTFSSTNALARTAPVFSYQNSGPRTVSITLELHRDLMNEINTNVSNLKSNVVDFTGDDYVDILVNYLQAVALPKYNNYNSGSKAVIPPMIAVRFGNDTFIKGVVNSGINITKAKPIMTDGKYAKISIQFTVYETDPYDADTVVAEGTFRGLTKTFKDGIYVSTTSNTTISQASSSRGNNSDELVSSVTKNGVTKTQRKTRDTTTGYIIPNTGARG